MNSFIDEEEEEEGRSNSSASKSLTMPSAKIRDEDYLSHTDYELTRSSNMALVELRREKRSVVAANAANMITLEDLISKTSQQKYSTGVPALDVLLCGGIPVGYGEMFELRGPSSSGKTGVCMKIMCMFARTHRRRVIYLDSGGNFDVTRFRRVFTQSHGSFDFESVADSRQISIFPTPRTVDLIRALHVLSADDTWSLLVIDSFSQLVFPLTGKKQPVGNAVSESILHAMRTLLDSNRSIILTTNAFYQDNGGLKPQLSAWWKYASHHVISLSPQSGSHVSVMCSLEATCSLPTVIGTTVPLSIRDIDS